MVKTTERVQDVVAWADEALAEQVEGNLEITLELWMKRNEIYTGSWMNFYNNQFFENSVKIMIYVLPNEEASKDWMYTENYTYVLFRVIK